MKNQDIEKNVVTEKPEKTELSESTVNVNKEKKSLNRVLIVNVAFFCAFLLFFSGLFVGSCNDSVRKANEIIKLINKYSVTVEDADKDAVARAIVGSVLSDDKYAVYYSKEEYERILREDQGIYKGIGITFLSNQKGEIIGNAVYDVQRNSSAYNAGIKSGDVIVYAKTLPDGEKKVFSDNGELFSFLSSAPDDTEIAFGVTREGEFVEKEFILIKEYYISSYVAYADDSEELNFVSEHGEKTKPGVVSGGNSSFASDTAMITLYGFEGDAAREFSYALDYMRQKGKTKLILDLRNNGGGFMTTLADIASCLIYNGGKKKSLIATAKEKNGDKADFYTSQNNFYDNVKHLCILANANTASASECLIGALAYYGKEEKSAKFSYDRLILTYNDARGDYSTYGKGIMQTTYTLVTGGAFKLTTAYIYQPDGQTCIHGVGITTTDSANRVESSAAVSRAIEILGNA